LEAGEFSNHSQKNPFYREYWSDLSHYHGNKSKIVRRLWDVIPERNDGVTWNPIICIEHAYEDYERSILNGEIKYAKGEAASRDIRPYTFQNKLTTVLECKDDEIFSLSIPSDVVTRVEERNCNLSFSNPPILTPRQPKRRNRPSTPIEKAVDDHCSTYMFVGSKETLLKKIDNYKPIESVKRKRVHHKGEPKNEINKKARVEL
jgi:hypothetical protein